MTAPTWTEGSDGFETMWDAMIDLVAVLLLRERDQVGK